MITFNWNLFLVLIALEIFLTGIFQILVGLFLIGNKKINEYGLNDILAGVINLSIIAVCLIL